MGMKHRIEFGVYTFKGSINTQLAEKTGFTNQDADKIHEALITLFENDSSSARPEGSMTIHKVYWWEHNSKLGDYPSSKVHNQVKISLKDDVKNPKSIEDYKIDYNPLDNLKLKLYEL
jgi:CRISPR-associated protein Csd2